MSATYTTPSSPNSEALELHQKTILAGTVGLSIAGVLTLVRLSIRFSRHKSLGWDDGFAILAMLLLVVTSVVGKLYYSLNSSSHIPQHSRIALFYVSTVTFNLLIWTSRLSVLATILRLGYYTRHLRVVAGFFVLCMAILVAQIFWVCEPQDHHNHWKSETHPQCALGKSVAIAQVTTDAFADVVLVIVPLLILRHLKSDSGKAERVRLGMSFAVGGLTTLVSIVHAYYLLKGDLVSVIVSSVEMSVSVIICNFTVLAAALHRAIKMLYLPSTTTRTQEQSIKFAVLPGTPSEQQISSIQTSVTIAPSSRKPSFELTTGIYAHRDNTTEMQRTQPEV